MGTEAMRRKLIGALVGLARASEGNEKRIAPQTDGVVLRALAACGNGGGEEVSEELLRQVEEAKWKLVPNCRTCASPCGHNADYDMACLELEPERIAAAKERLLQSIFSLAARTDNTVPEGLYRALWAIGADFLTEEELEEIRRELDGI